MSGIYIHIPFCKQACTYCNFHFSTSSEKKQHFLDALKNEIIASDNFIESGETIETIYFGGGTPSLLKSAEINEILDSLTDKFSIASDAEITLEANPDDINKEVLNEWIDIGINRLSVGIQSFDEEELKWMNRAHDAKQSLECIRLIQEAGMTNFSADLIFGGPFLSEEQLERNISIMIKNKIPHISAYALTVEEKTVLDQLIRAKKTKPVSTDKQAEHFLKTMKWLAEAGYQQYEISNYALPGMRSRHNSSYWKGIPYIGLGPSAHSFDGYNRRRWNIPNNSIYIKNWLNGNPAYEEETLTKTQQLNEYVMISLRTMEGISFNKISLEFGNDTLSRIIKLANPFIQKGLLMEKNEFLMLTKEGKLIADNISMELFSE